MTVYASFDFTGTNGAAWPSSGAYSWTTASSGTVPSPVADIQSNTGRLRVTGGGSPYDSIAVQHLNDSHTAVDFTGTISSSGSAEEYVDAWVRVTGTSVLAPLTDSYELSYDCSADAIYCSKYVAGVQTVFDTVTLAATTIGFRIRAVGSAIKFRVWDASGGEPGTWNVEVTDTSHTTGHTAVGVVNGFAGGAVTAFFDNLSLDDTATAGGSRATRRRTSGLSLR